MAGKPSGAEGQRAPAAAPPRIKVGYKELEDIARTLDDRKKGAKPRDPQARGVLPVRHLHPDC